MILKKLLLNLLISFVLTEEDCSSFFSASFQHLFITTSEKKDQQVQTSEKFVHYNINETKFPELSKYFELVVQEIRDVDDFIQSRNIAKYLKEFYKIDKFGKFFPSYCSYFEIENQNQKKSYFIIEKGGMTLAELQKKGGNKLLTFLEKFAVMKKIAKAVSIIHIYNFIICDLDMTSFKVFLEDKQYSDELLTDQLQAQNLRYFRMSTLIENQENQNCPIIKKFQGNESPEQIDRQILFDEIEKTFKQRSDVYSMAFIFVKLFLTPEEYEDLKNLSLTRTAKNVKEINQQIQKKVIELLNEVKLSQIDKSYHLGFDYFIQLIIRMLLFNPSDRLSSYDIFQGFIKIIQNKINSEELQTIKTTLQILFNSDEDTKDIIYTEEQIEEMQQQKEDMDELIDKIFVEDKITPKQTKTVDDSIVDYKRKNLPKFDQDENKKKQNSV